jgi:arabinofuranosyltransferase
LPHAVVHPARYDDFLISTKSNPQLALIASRYAALGRSLLLRLETGPNTFASISARAWITAFGAAVLLVFLLRTAWVSEDAYISFRVVSNFLSGYGLRWNTADRVQVFTDPLFVGLVTLVTWIGMDVYFATVAVSLVLTFAAFFLLAANATEFGVGILTAVLLFSKGFMDFSISGLENPATHCALAAYVFVYWRRRDPFWLSLIAALAVTNRTDTVLLFLPSLAITYFQAGPKAWKRILWGWSPFIFWSLFSLFYYGFLFPNTAYAKLHTGIPESDLLNQGIVYFINAIRCDTVTILAIAFGLVVAWLAREWLLGAGVVLYLIYIVRVGGDFMSARFFTAPLILSVAILVRHWRPQPVLAAGTIAVIAGLGMSIPSPTITSANTEFSTVAHPLDVGGIADERGYYYQGAGLLRYHRYVLWPDTGGSFIGHDLKVKGVKVFVVGNIGYIGYQAGPAVHIIDPFGLGDALLARLPVKPGLWRIGHFERELPAGYVDTITTGFNKISDPNIAEYYRHLQTVISGHLWTSRRVKEIFLFNIGYYEHLLPKYHDAPAQ